MRKIQNYEDKSLYENSIELISILCDLMKINPSTLVISKDFTFDDTKLLKGGLQERVTKIKEWVNGLPKEETWQVDLRI